MRFGWRNKDYFSDDGIVENENGDKMFLPSFVTAILAVLDAGALDI